MILFGIALACLSGRSCRRGVLTWVILTRRPNEAFIIELPTGEIIKVAALSVKPNQVRRGTDATGEIKIVKEERLQDQQNLAWVPTNQQKNTGD